MKKPPAPTHFSRAAQRLWRDLYRTYRFDLCASVLLLDHLCEAWDQERRCREALNGTDLTITSSGVLNLAVTGNINVGTGAASKLLNR